MQTFDLSTEEPITLADAAKLLPSSHSGKRNVSVRALLRWVQHGHRGVFLEARKFGHTWVTSKESLARFSEKLTANEKREAKDAPRSSSQARKGHQAAKARLAKTGIARRALSRK